MIGSAASFVDFFVLVSWSPGLLQGAEGEDPAGDHGADQAAEAQPTV